LEDNANAVLGQGERLILHGFGQSGKKRAYLLAVPPHGPPSGRKFTLLTDQHLDSPGETGSLEVLFCSIFPLHGGQSAALFSMNMDLSGDTSGSSRLACKNAAADLIRLPASTRESRFPFDKTPPFSYLQYYLEDLAEHQFVAVVDKASERTAGWVIAEFTESSHSFVRTRTGIPRLLRTPMHLTLPTKRPMMLDIKAPRLTSSLLAYHLSISTQDCGHHPQLFMPLIRQHITDIYESKFFVNARDVEIHLHGVAPYMPPALRDKDKGTGLSLQIWTDPTCESPVEITLRLDILGSFGKLWMRYRTLFAAFPLVVVAIVLRKQFKIYDETGMLSLQIIRLSLF
jgi:glycosylphosphatidylinositol deacylase